MLNPNANAWRTDVIWGAVGTSGQRRSHHVGHGRAALTATASSAAACAPDNTVWGTTCADASCTDVVWELVWPGDVAEIVWDGRGAMTATIVRRDPPASDHVLQSRVGLLNPMNRLPLPARLFVCGVIALGACVLVAQFPARTFSHLGVFLLLLVLSSVTSVFKVTLPLARSGSTMSVSYAVDFASLLLLGPNETMIVAAVSAWSQCTFRIKERNPIYRTLFSMACLVVTVQAAGRVYIWLGGVPGQFDPWTLAKPLVGAATTYFVINTAMIATAIALSTRQPILKIWNENFLWSAPSYFVGAGAAAAGGRRARISCRSAGCFRSRRRRST